MITENQLRYIVAQAMPLHERLQLSHYPEKLRVNSTQAAKKWQASWQASLGGIDKDSLQRRINWGGYKFSQVERMLATDPEKLVKELPSWAYTLAQGLLYLHNLVGEYPGFFEWVQKQAFVEEHDPLPYEDLFAPFVDWAFKQLTNECAEIFQILQPRAKAALGRTLLKRLAYQGRSCLELEFSLYRAKKQSSLVRFQYRTTKPTDDTLYRQFVSELLSGKITGFFSEYTVLARQIGLTIERWFVTNKEFLFRLEEDWNGIQEIFLNDTHSGIKVSDIELNLSDPHNGGRTVYSLLFSSGVRLIYKPKDIAIEVAYFELLDWFNQYVSLPFKTLKIINRSDYGWVEAAEHHHCSDEAAANRYYRRAGMLLCLLYALEATDCFFENIIASGEYPVLIDLETVMHQRHRREYVADMGEAAKVQNFAYDLLQNSVMRTGLLPSWHTGKNGSTFIGSGLGMVTEQVTDGRRLDTRNVNRDDMEIYFQQVLLHPGKSLPYLNDRPLVLSNYTEEVVSGFCEIYQLLMEKRTHLLGDETPMARLRQQKVRFLHRNTTDYFLPLRIASQPKYMRQGISRSLVFEKLFKRFIQLSQKPLSWKIAEAELSDLEAGDIPHFTTIANSCDINLPDGDVIPDYFARSAQELVQQRLRELSSVDLETQIGFIQAAIASSTIDERESIETTSDRLIDREGDLDHTDNPLCAEDFVTEAKGLAAKIGERAILSSDGEATWVVMGYNLDSTRYQLQPIEYNIYNGRCGIALFLSALAFTTGSEDANKLAQATIKPIQKQLQTTAGIRYLANVMNIGGLAGLGSLVYTFAKASTWLQDASLLDCASKIAELITPERINQDTEYEIIHGAAGTLLAILALHKCTGSSSLLRQARRCGDFLLNSRIESPAGLHIWQNTTGHFPTGFSHGAAGIAYSLLRLYGVTNDSSYKDAASEAIAFEQTVFDQEKGNWPDFGWVDPPRFMLTWCHGAPGIGLGRVGGVEFLYNESIHNDLDAALKTTRGVGIDPTDHLCCGNLGRLELYLQAASICDRPELHSLAWQQTSTIVRRKQQQGHYGIFPSDGALGNTFAPAFFRGTSGIGYFLLRLAYPELLPSVLLME